MNLHVRNTFISQAAFDALPKDRQQKIIDLVTEYQGLGYISAWDIGPDQWARISDRARKKMNKVRLRVFRIEAAIKELLKPDEQLAKEQSIKVAEELAKKKQSIQYRIRDLENYCKRKIESKRDNLTKQEYRRLKEELQKL